MQDLDACAVGLPERTASLRCLFCSFCWLYHQMTTVSCKWFSSFKENQQQILSTTEIVTVSSFGLTVGWLIPTLHMANARPIHLLAAWCFALRGTINLWRTYKRLSDRIDAWFVLQVSCKLHFTLEVFSAYDSVCLLSCSDGHPVLSVPSNLMSLKCIKRIKPTSPRDIGNIFSCNAWFLRTVLLAPVHFGGKVWLSFCNRIIQYENY